MTWTGDPTRLLPGFENSPVCQSLRDEFNGLLIKKATPVGAFALRECVLVLYYEVREEPIRIYPRKKDPAPMAKAEILKLSGPIQELVRETIANGSACPILA